jgi:hypothetical protein
MQSPPAFWPRQLPYSIRTLHPHQVEQQTLDSPDHIYTPQVTAVQYIARASLHEHPRVLKVRVPIAGLQRNSR